MDGWWVASYVVLWVLVVVLSIVIVALARQIGTLHLRLGPRGALEIDDEGPPLGEAPQPVAAADIKGRAVTIGGPGSRRLLLFVSPGCRMCEVVLAGIDSVAAGSGLIPYVLSDVDAPHVGSLYDVPGTPYVVILDERGIVRGKGTINNLEQMEGLVDTAQGRMTRAAEELPAT